MYSNMLYYSNYLYYTAIHLNQKVKKKSLTPAGTEIQAIFFILFCQGFEIFFSAPNPKTIWWNFIYIDFNKSFLNYSNFILDINFIVSMLCFFFFFLRNVRHKERCIFLNKFLTWPVSFSIFNAIMPLEGMSDCFWVCGAFTL